MGRIPKPRITQTMKDAMLPKKVNTRASDLNFLSSQFDVVQIKLTQLIEALKSHYKSLIQVNKSRLMVAEKVAALAAGTPLENTAGELRIDDGGEETSLENMNSYLEVHQAMSVRHKMYTERYVEHIVQYTLKWFNMIHSQVSTSLKKADRLRKELDHYKSKVNRLTFDKKRVSKSGAGDAYTNVNARLERNEDKFRKAKEEYESFSSVTSALVEEVTTGCWKDLFPVLLKLTQFDTSLVSDEKKVFQQLNSVTKSLTSFYQKCDLNIDNRQEELEAISNNVHYISQSPDCETTTDENQDAIISGVQDSLRVSRSQRSDNMESSRSQSSSRREPSFEAASEGGTTRIRSFAGKSPKVEVDISSIEVKSEKVPSPSQSRAFTGRPTDQNAGPPVIKQKHKIKKNKSPVNSATQSYCNHNVGDPFDEIDEDSRRFPLTPDARYE